MTINFRYLFVHSTLSPLKDVCYTLESCEGMLKLNSEPRVKCSNFFEILQDHAHPIERRLLRSWHLADSISQSYLLSPLLEWCLEHFKSHRPLTEIDNFSESTLVHTGCVILLALDEILNLWVEPKTTSVGWGLQAQDIWIWLAFWLWISNQFGFTLPHCPFDRIRSRCWWCATGPTRSWPLMQRNNHRART